MEDMEYSPLPAAEKSWALVTGAATGLGWKLAKACANAGYGLILTDQVTSLQGLEESYKTLGLPESRILKMPMNLADPSEGVALLHRQIRQQGLDVCILFVCSDQYSYTGNFLEQRVDNLDTMLALNVGATTVLCRLFGEDMLKAGRGRILLIGAPAGASLGVAGASAFAGSMAFIRTLSNGLRREFADTGVGISCMETSSLGRDGSLTEALGSTCVGFLVKDDVDAKAAVASGNRTSTRAAKAVENFTPKSKGDTEVRIWMNWVCLWALPKIFRSFKGCYFVILQAMIDEAVNDEYLRCILSFWDEQKKTHPRHPPNHGEFLNHPRNLKGWMLLAMGVAVFAWFCSRLAAEEGFTPLPLAAWNLSTWYSPMDVGKVKMTLNIFKWFKVITKCDIFPNPRLPTWIEKVQWIFGVVDPDLKAEIDRFQHAPLSEVSSALLVGSELSWKPPSRRKMNWTEKWWKSRVVGL